MEGIMGRVNVYRYNQDPFGGEPKELAGYFYDDKAECFEEATRWNGNNHISVHTGDQWSHQALYRTAGGQWVLYCWSQRQGTGETYEFVSDEQARTWLLANEDDGAVEQYFGSLADEEGPAVGRPEIGPAFSLRFPPELLAKVDAAAKAESVSRAGWIRSAAEAALDR